MSKKDQEKIKELDWTIKKSYSWGNIIYQIG
jgi:hypothetical protein